MNQSLIFIPCFTLIIITYAIILTMFFKRKKAILNGKIDFRHFKTYDFSNEVPKELRQIERHVTNLFEAPLIFYIVCLFGLVLRGVDCTFLTLAWSYVGIRLVHTFIHLTSNKILIRAGAYGLSWLVIIIMGIKLTINIL